MNDMDTVSTCRICKFTWTEPPGAHECNVVKDGRHEALRKSAQDISDAHWGEYSHIQMRPLVRVLDELLRGD